MYTLTMRIPSETIPQSMSGALKFVYGFYSQW
jgi:hypothetical protein